jgi:uncharacterized protein (TIGR03083 family)
MTTLADRTIAALRANYDALAALVPALTDAQLTGHSGASEWSVAQVLSHMGSGAEITLATYQAALDGVEAPGQDFNESVWARWDASTPQDQATNALVHGKAITVFLEALSSEQRETLQVKLGFLPMPLSLAAVAGMRLNENALHLWDVQVALDPSARVDAGAADVLGEHFSADLGFLLGFIGKADAVATPARVHLGTSDLAIVIADGVSVTTAPGDATATFHGQLESVIRLIGGRLGPQYTPADVSVEGNLSLEDLRRVFPGY